MNCRAVTGRAGYYCRACGRAMRRDEIRECVGGVQDLGPAVQAALARASRHPGPQRCRHLGAQKISGAGRGSEPRPLTIKVKCCQGREAFLPLFACDVHGRCLPDHAPTGQDLADYLARPDAVRLCDGCPDRY